METSAGVNALTIVFAALCVFAIAYRFYGLFLAQKVLSLDAARQTPAVRQADGKDYVATDRYVLFGHHFAAIAAAGPLLGPVLAAQFGYMPGLLWILIGCVLAGGVHDMVVLFCSVRHRGRSLAYIASTEVDKRTGFVASWAVLAILILTLPDFRSRSSTRCTTRSGRPTRSRRRFRSQSSWGSTCRSGGRGTCAARP